MAINNIKIQDGEFEEKRFFSDYKEVNGFMIANKINIESKQSGKVFSSETSEEMTIKSIKFNPTFKPNSFEVKK